MGYFDDFLMCGYEGSRSSGLLSTPGCRIKNLNTLWVLTPTPRSSMHNSMQLLDFVRFACGRFFVAVVDVV